MIRLFDQANYDFLAKRKLWLGIAFAFVIPGILLFFVRGLNESIEFTGGTLMIVRRNDSTVNTASIRAALEQGGITNPEIQTYGAERLEFAIRSRLSPQANETTQETAEAVEQALTNRFGADAYEVVLTEAVGPKVGGELRQRAVLALLMGFGGIFLYVWWRYEWRFSVAAVIATFYDIASTFAFLVYLNLEVSLFVVAGLLLMVGYSLNDTIITFDRVRENLKKYRRDKLYAILNRSINETLPRTVLTSGTTLGASLALVILGGSVLSGPIMIVSFGILTGTFSSIFIAAPLLLWIEQRWPGEDIRGAKDIETPEATIIAPKNA